MARERAHSRVKLSKQKNFRLEETYARKLELAARQAGLTESEWLRLVVRTALGDRSLLEQLLRATEVKAGAQARKRRR